MTCVRLLTPEVETSYRPRLHSRAVLRHLPHSYLQAGETGRFAVVTLVPSVRFQHPSTAPATRLYGTSSSLKNFVKAVSLQKVRDGEPEIRSNFAHIPPVPCLKKWVRMSPIQLPAFADGLYLYLSLLPGSTRERKNQQHGLNCARALTRVLVRFARWRSRDQRTEERRRGQMPLPRGRLWEEKRQQKSRTVHHCLCTGLL